MNVSEEKLATWSNVIDFIFQGKEGLPEKEKTSSKLANGRRRNT